MWVRPLAEFLIDVSDGFRDCGRGPTSPFPLHGTYINRYSDQIVFGFHHLYACIGKTFELNCPEIYRYRFRLDHHISAKGWEGDYMVPQIDRNGEEYTADFSRLTPENVIHLRRALLASPLEPLNWAHWLLHVVPLLWRYVSTGQTSDLLCYSDQPWQKQILQMLGVDSERVVAQDPRASYLCDDLILPQFSLVDLAVREPERVVFGELIERYASRADITCPKRIFISRHSLKATGGRYRALMNEKQVIDAFEEIGFVTVEPQKLSFAEQIALFHNADVVVGLSGAGMFNTVFCKPGTRVVCLAGGDTFMHEHANVFASAGMKYGFVFGQSDTSANMFPHNPWTIDCAGVMRAVGNFGD
jgi:capsular polysaccharide biosynthesis protein